MDWCQRVGGKLLDDTISTKKILEHVIIPEKVEQRPNVVPLIIEWPHYFLARNEEAVFVEIEGGVRYPFYQVALEITAFTNKGLLLFHVTTDEQQVEYKVVFSKQRVDYEPVSETIVYLSTSKSRRTLTEWFQDEPPIITFEDASKLEYNELLAPKGEGERMSYDASTIQEWDWEGVKINKESQYKAQGDPKRLVHHKDSIQHRVIKNLQTTEAQPGYDIIFDDDGPNEIADIVALKVEEGSLLVHLFHCKYSRADTSGARVGDFYDVCGQAQKSVYWRHKTRDLFERLKRREMQRKCKYGVSRFATGGLKKLEELSCQSPRLEKKFCVTIVQPGLHVQEVTTPILDLLGTTSLYLKEAFDVPLTVIGNENGKVGKREARA